MSEPKKRRGQTIAHFEGTPGPWRATFSPVVGGSAIGTFDIQGTLGYGVAGICVDRKTESADAANATLIAEAPTMLAFVNDVAWSFADGDEWGERARSILKRLKLRATVPYVRMKVIE